MIIYNNIIPFKGYKAMAIFPFIFVRKKWKGNLSKYTLNHEKIHFRQQLEHLIIFFYIIYFIEYLLKGYKRISFEKEAYKYAHDLNYLKTRKPYSNYTL